MTKRLLVGLLPLTAAALAFGQHIRTTVNGEPVHFSDVQPVSMDGRVLVPVRGVFEHMGVNVDWEPASQAVYATGNGREVTLYVNKRVAKVDGKDVELDVPAQLYHGRTIVPLRFISEAMGAVVDWDADNELVAITTNGIGAANAHYVPRDGYRRNRDRNRDTSGVRTQPIANTVVLAANTVIPVVLNQRLSSNDSSVGDTFTATVDNSNGNRYMGLPDGTIIEGHVSTVRAMSGRTPGVLGLAFDRFRFPDGRSTDLDGSLIGLDTKSIDNVNGRLVARKSSNRDTKYVGIGAGAGALIALATKNNVLTTTVIGAALGYLYDQQQNQNRRDVTLGKGTQFGVVLNQDETIPAYNN
jgi:hypothetical protein